MLKTRRAAVTGFGVEFRPFLQSQLWEEINGTPLSILSALARLDLDPWKEAETLAQLPRDLASQRLSALLRQLPGAPIGADPGDPLWTQTLGLLPNKTAPAAPEGVGTSGRAAASRWILVIALAYFSSILAYYAIVATHLPIVHGDKARPTPPAAVSTELTTSTHS